jgi:hypothetical protein
MCSLSRIASNDGALGIADDINKKMAFAGREARGELTQVQVLESEVVHLAHFESTDTQNQSRRDSLVEKLQTIDLSFRTAGENEDHI